MVGFDRFGDTRYVRQDYEDLEKMMARFEARDTGSLANMASWILSAYWSVLYEDSGTTYGEITKLFFDDADTYAGFGFEDQDSDERFKVIVVRDDDPY